MVKIGVKNCVTHHFVMQYRRNCLTTWRYKALAKGYRGLREPERQAVGCDPKKFFLQISQNHNIHKINTLAKSSSEQ
jgi:hypothetical protein